MKRGRRGCLETGLSEKRAVVKRAMWVVWKSLKCQLLYIFAHALRVALGDGARRGAGSIDGHDRDPSRWFGSASRSRRAHLGEVLLGRWPCVKLASMCALRGLVLASMLVAACAPIVGITDLDVEVDAEEDASAPPSEQPRTDSAVPDDASSSSDDDAASDAGIVEKRVFVTSTAFNGIMGGAAGVDARCVAAADRVGLGGDWIAWISADGNNAIDRITHDGPYVRLDGARVVRDKSQLASGVLTSPIRLTEKGEAVTENLLVWTGTFVDGTFSTDCNNWSTSNVLTYGAMGTLSRVDHWWTDNGGPGGGFRNWGCQTSARLYCFER